MLLFTALRVLVPVAAETQPVETELPASRLKSSNCDRPAACCAWPSALRTAREAKKDEFNRYTFDRIVLVDVKSKKKHLPLKDANGQYIGGPIGDWLNGGRIALKVPNKQSTVLWAYFEPVAPGTVMNVEVPYVFPFENVPVTEGTGKVFASGTAGSTPSGVRATLVSARRADQVLNVRLRIEPEKGETAETLHNRLDSYFIFKDVFLFDPVAKRKYLLIKDTEGYFQAQPLTVKMDGGRFIHDWRKTTLVSLAFQAPPDTVQRADLLLPQFLPFEAMTIEGLGGAAAGGVEAAGTTLGLEGALKELKAEVTATEIKIDLAADVLFDFDKAEIRSRRNRVCKTRNGAQGEPKRDGDHRGHRRQGCGCLQPDSFRTTRRFGEAMARGECSIERREHLHAWLGEVEARHA